MNSTSTVEHELIKRINTLLDNVNVCIFNGTKSDVISDFIHLCNTTLNTSILRASNSVWRMFKQHVVAMLKSENIENSMLTLLRSYVNQFNGIESELRQMQYIVDSQYAVRIPENDCFSFYSWKTYVEFVVSSFKNVLTSLGFQFNRFLYHVSDIQDVFFRLNIDSAHSALTETETFFVDSQHVLTPHATVHDTRFPFTHTGMFYTIGEVFRRDDDRTHLTMFSQLELLCIGTEYTLIDLKTYVSSILQYVYDRVCSMLCMRTKTLKFRFRPHNFPYTVPSFELDMLCSCMLENGCMLCSSGWIEVLGAGILKDNVKNQILKKCQVPIETYDDYVCLAAGLGIERTTTVLVNMILNEKKSIHDSYVS